MKLTAGEIEQQLARLPEIRAACPACQGNADICRAGSATLDRVQGCIAFDDHGNVVDEVVVARRQPWEPRIAA